MIHATDDIHTGAGRKPQADGSNAPMMMQHPESNGDGGAEYAQHEQAAVNTLVTASRASAQQPLTSQMDARAQPVAVVATIVLSILLCALFITRRYLCNQHDHSSVHSAQVRSQEPPVPVQHDAHTQSQPYQYGRVTEQADAALVQDALQQQQQQQQQRGQSIEQLPQLQSDQRNGCDHDSPTLSEKPEDSLHETAKKNAEEREHWIKDFQQDLDKLPPDVRESMQQVIDTVTECQGTLDETWKAINAYQQLQGALMSLHRHFTENLLIKKD